MAEDSSWERWGLKTSPGAGGGEGEVYPSRRGPAPSDVEEETEEVHRVQELL